MSRSLKKGPFVDDHLLEEGRRSEHRRRAQGHQDLEPSQHHHPRHGRPHHRCPRRPQARAGVRHRVDGRSQVGRVQPDSHLPLSRRTREEHEGSPLMTGPKLNEATMVAGERSGTKASALYLRVSASKARVVLNLIRGLPVKRADEVLQFSDREVSNDIRKVLASAVANAQHNDEQDPDELFVKACFADEGPTLKRFTPRARGRGNRINKRTCHITIVLARLDDAKLEVVQAREARRTAAGRRRPAAGGTSASRRARVERSRQTCRRGTRRQSRRRPRPQRTSSACRRRRRSSRDRRHRRCGGSRRD